MNWTKRKRPLTSVLALSLTGGRLEAVTLRRTNGSISVEKNFAASLGLNPLTGDPELVGREIRNNLDQAGIKDRKCVVCIPLSWVLVQAVKLPQIPDEDAVSLLQIEAERGFPYSIENLMLSHSICTLEGESKPAIVTAVQRTHVDRLEAALRAAKLSPIGFTVAITALQPPDDKSIGGRLTLVVGEDGVDAQVTCGGGVASLRCLDGMVEGEGSQKSFDSDMLARELRITLAQLRAEAGVNVTEARVFGRTETPARFVEQVVDALRTAGLKAVVSHDLPPAVSASMLPAGTPASEATAAGAYYLSGRAPVFEFLPERLNAVQQFMNRFNSKRLAYVGIGAGAAAALVIGAFLVQQIQLMSLRSKWSGMAAKVHELEGFQQQIRQYRPWFDNSFRNLTIMKKLVEAFPDDSAVSIKTLEIREQSAVSCTGVARDTQALLKTLDSLRASREVGEVKVDQLRGKAPVQFTFNFHWQEGGADGN